MIVTPIRTPRIEVGSSQLHLLVSDAISKDMLPEGSVLAVTSKIVSICEGNVVPMDSVTKADLIVQASDYYLPRSTSDYGLQFTITDGSLIPTAGIDESNGGDYYILWPKDSQATANGLRVFLETHFGLKHVGVVITDSTCHPMRRGTRGIAIAHSGFAGLNSYVGEHDLFGRPFKASQSDVAAGLASAAVATMGEGAESTPLCVLSDIPFVRFTATDPSPAELEEIRIPKERDLFAPFLQKVDWQRGSRRGTAPDR